MGLYTLRLFDPREKIARMYEGEYRDALDALDAAESLATDCMVEVWDDSGRIARVKQGCAPSLPSDPFPG